LQWLPGILSRSGESSVCTRGFLIVSHIGIVCPEVPIYSRPRKHAHEPDGAARGAAAAGGGEGTAAASEERGGGEGSVGETAVMELRSDATTLRADGGATAGVAAAVGEGDGAFGALAVASGGGLGGSGLDGGGFGAVGEGAATVWEELKKKTSKTDVHDADEKSGKGKKEKKKGDKGGKEEYGEEAVVNDELWGEDKSALVHCMETRAVSAPPPRPCLPSPECPRPRAYSHHSSPTIVPTHTTAPPHPRTLTYPHHSTPRTRTCDQPPKPTASTQRAPLPNPRLSPPPHPLPPTHYAPYRPLAPRPSIVLPPLSP
jgi:hypothetical protein